MSCFPQAFARWQKYFTSLLPSLCALQSLLHDPNPNSPANNEAAQLYRENRREYEKKVAAIVQASWNDDDDEDQ